MNDQNTKKILFNKSTLISLKAELLKKKEEVKEKKRLPQHKLENFKPAPSKAPGKKERPIEDYAKSFKERLKEVDTDELEACRKSRSALEKKAELYEHLADTAGSSQLASQFLVDFNNKKKHELSHVFHQVEENVTTNNEESSGIHDETFNDDENDWAEFTDCLGRTRKCLKSDLDFYLSKDVDLKKAIDRNTDDADIKDDESITSKEKPFLVQKTNDYLQSLREKWEQKEKELLAKNTDVHYQDVLFDEARIHGVGYFSFSTDEAERQKQMEELKKTREATLQAQREATEKRKKREELVAARVSAARARRRLRAGLPPEDPEEARENFTKKLLEFLNEQKNEAEKKAKEEEMKLKEEQEKERQKLRENYVREWDLGKEGVEDKKKFREMTQEEYVEQQRSKRIDEFAPLKEKDSSRAKLLFNDTGKLISPESGEYSRNLTWNDVRPAVRIPPPPVISDFEPHPREGLYFTTAKKDQKHKKVDSPNVPPPPVISDVINNSTKVKKDLKYKNFHKSNDFSTPIPSMNELDEDNVDERKESTQKRKTVSGHTEIAPPATFDYYGPVSKHFRANKPFESDLGEAYAQGAKSLEAKQKNLNISKQYDFTFD